MAAAVVTVVVEDILHSLQEGMELGQQWGVEHEFREIHRLLSPVMGVLPETENKYGHNFELQEWVQKLKEAALDTEDLLQELSVEDALWQRKRKVHRLFRAIDRLTFQWRIRAELRAVARQLQDLIRPDRISYVRNILDEIGEAYETEVAVPFIGRDQEKGELMRLLLHLGRKRGQDPPLLTVLGNEGIGKTALVHEVCSESEVRCHFDVILWVNASPPFDESRMARDIIASLTNGGSTEEENAVEEQLLFRIRKVLDGRKKYLFILDNLLVQDSGRQRWSRFWSFLKGGDTGSKILVIARYHKLMSYEDSPTFHLGDLTRIDSLNLLLKIASKGGVEEIIDPAKLQIAEDVASEFAGDPLIIRAVGHYLSLQHDTNDWSRLRDMLRTLRHYDFYSTFVYGGYPYDHLSPMVKRYNHLLPRIQQCFGLCSLFPRGHVIDRQTLAELWIAIGYIKSSSMDDRPLEDIADDYFNQLLMEGLFQVKKLDTFGKVRSVALHPDAENLARAVVGWERRLLDWYDYSYGVEKARHLSVSYRWPLNASPINLTKLRSVLYFQNDSQETVNLYNCLIPNEKRALARVLDVQHINERVVPKAVGKLKHLRYLNLSHNRRIETLPPAITGLLNLQTLKLSGCRALKELPQDMQKMVSLRHLYIDGCRKLCLMPKGLGDLKFLNILTDFILPSDDSSSIDSAKLSDIFKMSDLRGSLRITNLGYSEATGETFERQGLLDKKSSLESLELIFMNLPTDISLLGQLQPHPNLKGLRIHNYGAAEFPEWMDRTPIYLPNLVEIALIGCENCEYLPQFGQMRHLKSLTIQGLPDLLCMESGPELSSSDVGNNAQPFGELSSLCIRYCPKLECLPLIPHLVKLTLVDVSEHMFEHPFCTASLKTLRLENIKLLDHLPEHWLRYLISLEELHNGSCPSLVSLSRGMMPLENLESLSIWNCMELDLSKDEHGNIMMELEGLKSLKFLTIYKTSKMEYLPDWLSRVYTLRFLCIRSCPNLVALPEWIRILWSLELVHCPQLTSLQAGMYKFTNEYPRKLSIIGCPLLQREGIRHSHKL